MKTSKKHQANDNYLKNCSLLTLIMLNPAFKHRRLIHANALIGSRETKPKALRKHAYSNTLKILPPKNDKFQIKKSDIFHISAQNIDCGYSLEPPQRGGSNGYPQSMFFSRIKKNNVHPCEPQFYYIKVGFKGVKII